MLLVPLPSASLLVLLLVPPSPSSLRDVLLSLLILGMRVSSCFLVWTLCGINAFGAFLLPLIP